MQKETKKVNNRIFKLNMLLCDDKPSVRKGLGYAALIGRSTLDNLINFQYYHFVIKLKSFKPT